jgi:hypothetical protein
MPKDRPVREIRLSCVKATIWKNDSPTGTRYSTTFTRLYKKGEQWQSTNSFGRDDLLVLAKVADSVHSWIFKQKLEPDTKGES